MITFCESIIMPLMWLRCLVIVKSDGFCLKQRKGKENGTFVSCQFEPEQLRLWSVNHIVLFTAAISLSLQPERTALGSHFLHNPKLWIYLEGLRNLSEELPRKLWTGTKEESALCLLRVQKEERDGARMDRWKTERRERKDVELEASKRENLGGNAVKPEENARCEKSSRAQDVWLFIPLAFRVYLLTNQWTESWNLQLFTVFLYATHQPNRYVNVEISSD